MGRVPGERNAYTEDNLHRPWVVPRRVRLGACICRGDRDIAARPGAARRACHPPRVEWVLMSVVGVVVLAVLALVLVQIVRMGWRFLRGDEDMESGDSFGWQLFGRRKEKPR
jgi:hypothetical protein